MFRKAKISMFCDMATITGEVKLKLKRKTTFTEGRGFFIYDVFVFKMVFPVT